MAEGTFPKTDGSILYASEVNNLHTVIKQVYTDVGFNSSQSGSGTDTQDHELDAQGATDRDYVKVSITGTHYVKMNTANTNSSTTLKAQIKETGGAYGDIIAYKTILKDTKVDAGSLKVTSSPTYQIIATLTAGQKTNGYQVKVFSQSITDNATNVATFTNIQTILEES